MKSTVKLINHASAKINVDGISIISDPWYEGSVFHKGWKLIHELTIEETKKHLEKTDYIYVSHEHPDHFSPGFFFNKEYKSILEKYKSLAYGTSRQLPLILFFIFFESANFNGGS